LSTYSVIPGVSFTGIAQANAPADIDGPIYLFSHGRSGFHGAYTQLAEGLAARGAHVVIVDHPGDTMADWALGVAVDDATNERQRLEDMEFVVSCMLDGHEGLPELTGRALYLGGHSYGAYSALGSATSLATRSDLRGIVVLEPYLRTLTAEQLAAIAVPTTAIAGDADLTTPADIDPPHAVAHMNGEVLTVEIFDHVGHQGCSDVGLYLERLPQYGDLPQLVVDYLTSMAADITGTAGDPWRPVVERHVDRVAQLIGL
jgi:pimeloyl-ACP methyl ester carboxylesterase